MTFRAPREVDPAYKAWIAKLPCVTCFTLHGKFVLEVQVAHCRISDAEAGWRNVGMAEKPDDRKCTPLCMAHHQGDRRVTRAAQHQTGERAWWEAMGVDVFSLVRDLNFAFDHGRLGASVIALHAGRARRLKMELTDG